MGEYEHLIPFQLEIYEILLLMILLSLLMIILYPQAQAKMTILYNKNELNKKRLERCPNI